MRRRVIIALCIVAALSGAAFAGSNLFFFAGSAGGTPIASCGTGVIDLSAGCTITVLLGLGP